MRLTTIKLSGFKSFVDPTTVHFPSNIIGIVGPNGCGKSNIIDAVRWVMGESSAKHLRGESMADVIFNGSSSRKPVGQAFIELLFDNSDGKIVGAYAGFNEIAIKRLVSRDGTSVYMINNAKCRKRDIIDVFLGTGLGPRSYSIIEQGMISRLIEARPEELRVFLEEAAGISKYKERRRETQNRIKHTRENLDRLNDLREEIDKQITRLQRQAKAAEKYKEYKKEERKLQAELLALKLRDLDKEIETAQSHVSKQETKLQETIAQQRFIEADMEKQRADHHEATDTFNEVQGRYYGIGGDIARKEQAIQHARDMHKKQESDLEETRQNFAELQTHITNDELKVTNIKASLETSEPLLQQANASALESREVLSAAEDKMHLWQGQWDDYNKQASVPSEIAQVEKIRIEQLQKQNQQFDIRLEKLAHEETDLVGQLSTLESALQGLDISVTEQQKIEISDQRDNCQSQISEKKQTIQDLLIDLDESREGYQEKRARLLSLEAIQAAALGSSADKAENWIQRCQLENAPRLIDQLSVEAGWETAVELVLGNHIDAICVDNIDTVTGLLHSLEGDPVSVFEKTTASGMGEPVIENQDKHSLLISKISSPWSVDTLIPKVYVAQSLAEAMEKRTELASHESVITREGVWMGRFWIKVAVKGEIEGSVLERKQEIESLTVELDQLAEDGQALKKRLDHQQELMLDLETERDSLQENYIEIHHEYSGLVAKIDAGEQKTAQLNKRNQEIKEEKSDLDQTLEANTQEVSEARERLEQALQDIDSFTDQRENLLNTREELKQQLEVLKEKSHQDSDSSHLIELENESFKTQLTSTQENLERMCSQVEGLSKRQQELEQALHDSDIPIHDMEIELKDFLQQRVEVEAELNLARKTLDDIDSAIRKNELDRNAVEQTIQEIRGKLESLKMAWQEVRVRRQTVHEQFDETGFDQQEVTEGLPESASSKDWKEQVVQIEKRISRLGAINLAAIDEYTEEVERKKYLDSQFDDVTEALTTLESAMQKIDRETKAKFKDTFDKVNNGLSRMFPRLFGGGQAYLELTDDDLLNAGVTIMARPPGKRNSTIHLLSGGEKALTAVAMVFSIFLLNPSPFCMLDEVDAPLDDANVGRFCELVKEMSDQVQFIVITHNKVTMAMANQLSGVTMQEPGVSRMVSVDVDEAVKLAAV